MLHFANMCKFWFIVFFCAAATFAGESNKQELEAYPWDAETASVAGRYLAIQHVLGSKGSQLSPDVRQPSPVLAAMIREVSIGPVGLALTDSRIQDQRWKSSQMMARISNQRFRAASTMSRIQDMRWRNSQTLSRIQDQRWRTSQMMSRIQDQQWRTSQTLSRIQDQKWRTSQMMSRIQDQQWRTSQMMSRIQDQRWRTSQMMSQIQDQRWRTSQMMSQLSDMRWKNNQMISRMQQRQMESRLRNSAISGYQMRVLEARAVAAKNAMMNAGNIASVLDPKFGAVWSATKVGAKMIETNSWRRPLAEYAFNKVTSKAKGYLRHKFAVFADKRNYIERQKFGYVTDISGMATRAADVLRNARELRGNWRQMRNPAVARESYHTLHDYSYRRALNNARARTQTRTMATYQHLKGPTFGFDRTSSYRITTTTRSTTTIGRYPK